MKYLAVMLCVLGLAGCNRNGFKEPLMAPDVAWNPQKYDGKSYPCPQPLLYPYFHGWDSDGEPDCTVRPLDMLNEDIDTLTVP